MMRVRAMVWIGWGVADLGRTREIEVREYSDGCRTGWEGWWGKGLRSSEERGESGGAR